jgi:hypothetical protein
MYIGEPKAAALKTVGKPFVIDAQQVHNDSLDVKYVDRFAHWMRAELIGLSIGEPGLNPAAVPFGFSAVLLRLV